jgi:L-aminopeptidase/D-esterase-like protein
VGVVFCCGAWDNENMTRRVQGIKIGHAQDEKSLTGCTVVLCESGAVCGIDRRGGGTTTRQADAFEPWHVVDKVYGVLLTGGSAFGLHALSGVLQYLEERRIGFDMRVARVPIVAAAGLFDLGIGDGRLRPTPEMAYEACLNASERWPEEGCVGAGTGATVGKILGIQQATKSGIGMAQIAVGPELLVEAVVAVNAGGNVIDPSNSQTVAGIRAVGGEGGEVFANALSVLATLTEAQRPQAEGDNTVIGVVTTNAALSKIQATKVAQMAQDGLARTVLPAHTMYDGDTFFTLATGEVAADVSVVGAFAAEAVSQAILRAVRLARGMGGLPSATDLSQD